MTAVGLAPIVSGLTIVASSGFVSSYHAGSYRQENGCGGHSGLRSTGNGGDRVKARFIQSRCTLFEATKCPIPIVYFPGGIGFGYRIIRKKVSKVGPYWRGWEYRIEFER